VAPERVLALVQAAILGVVSIVTAVVFIVVASRAADGRLARNQWVGIRTRSTMCSDEAWQAGHRAALRLTPLLLVATALMCAALAATVLYVPAPGVVQLVGFGVIGAILAVVVYIAFVADRAAKSDDDRPGGGRRR